MNKTILAPLFTMLVVSCGTTLPSFESSVSSLLSSQDESSIISQVTSSSSIVSSSSSTSSSTTSSLQSTSSSSSSTSTSSSTSSTTSEPPLNTRKVPFNQIGSLVAQVVDAKAMGVVNSKDRPQVSGRKSAQDEDQNYMVKVTETYNPNTEITEDQTVKVTFSRVTNTQTTELQTGTESYVATAEALEIERLTDLPGNIVISNVEGNQYRLLSEEVVVQDWIGSQLETLEFIFDEALTGITLESRSLNASISFIAFEGFTYTIKQGETVISEDLQDNDEADNNDALGNITLSGLTEGLTYDVTYEGYQVIETITQDEVEGQVDKLYVLYQYTFVSFVPLTINQRPQDKDLELDYDDVPLYDKQSYFSDSTRQSFVVDNNTGLIYKIENINIASLSGGCVSVQDSPFPFDMRITENNALEFYSLHQNATIFTDSCIKDKYGNKFIRNNKINFFDNTSRTYFFVFDESNNQNGIKTNYHLSNNGEIVAIDYYSNSSTGVNYIDSASIMLSNQDSRNLTFSDSFEFYIGINEVGFSFPYKVEEGTLYLFSEKLTQGRNIYLPYFSIYTYKDAFTVKFSFGYSWDHSWSLEFLFEFNFILEFYNDQLVVFRDFYQFLREFYLANSNNIFLNIGENYFIYDLGPKSLSTINSQGVVLLNQVSLENNKLTKFGLSGNIYYDLIPEYINNEWVLTSYIAGTYTPPTITTITLQPINR